MKDTPSRKRQRSNDEIPVTPQQQESTESNSIAESHVTKKWKQVKKIVIYTESNPDDLELDFEADDIDGSMRDVTEIFGHDTYTIERQLDGAIAIRPCYRQLPTEIVSMIVDHVCDFDDQRDLHACSFVNKQFHMVANPLLWNDPQLLDSTALNRLVRYLSDAESPSQLTNQIKSLTLDGKHWTDAYLLLLLPHLRHLENLRIGDSASDDITTSLTYESFYHLPRHCRQLKELDVSRSYLSESVYLELGQHCHQLCVITIDHSMFLPPNIFELLAACPLTSIWIDYHESPLGVLGAEGDRLVAMAQPGQMDFLTFSQLVTDLPHFHHLAYLSINGLRSSNVERLFTFSWPKLVKLHLDDCSTLDDATLIPFLQAHSHLDDISLSGSNIPGVTNATLDTMAASLPHLRHLNLINLPNTSLGGMRRLVRGAPYLASLKLVNACDTGNKILDQSALDKVRQIPVVAATTNTT